MALNHQFIRETGPARWLVRTSLRQFSKRILHRDNRIVLPTGLPMTLPRASHFASEVFITRCNVDWGSEALFARLLPRSGAFLDIGANIGYYSLYMLPRVAEVHAFEPDPRAAAILQQNLDPYAEGHVHAMALGNRIGRAGFAQSAHSETSHLATTGDGLQVEISTVDRFVAERNLSVAGIKIDVEGTDLDVLHGARSTLESQRPLVLTESSASEALFDLTGLLGYRVSAFVRTPRGFHFTELRRSGQYDTKMLFLAPPELQVQLEYLSTAEGNRGAQRQS